VKLRARTIAVAAAAGGLLAGILSGGSLPVAAATAGTYTITTCSPGSSAGAWQPVNQAPASMTAGSLCGNGTPAIGPNNQITDTGALFGEDLIGSTTPVPNGDEAGWQLTVPAGVTITGISYYSSYETDGDGWLSGLLIDGTPVASDCETNLNQTNPCSLLNDQVAQVQSGLDASSLFFGTVCDQVDGGTRCAPAPSGSHNAEADLYSAQVTLVESGGPLVQGEGGALWSSGPVWGTATLTFDAADPSGIQTVEVQTPEGGNLATVQQSCDFSQVQACPELPSGQVQVNTLGLPDGSEHVSLKLTNAAGDTTVVQGPTLVIDNNGPPAPTSLTAAAVSSTSDTIDLSWADPANPPEPVQYAYAQLCQTSCQAPVPVSTSGGAQITAPAAGTYTVRVWLTDIEGRGSSANAATTSVTVPAQPTTTTTTSTTTSTTPPPPKCKPAAKCPVFKVTSATWAKNRLKLTFAKLPKRDRIQITIYYAHKPKRTVTTTKSKLTLTTTRPKRLLLRAFDGKRQQGATVTVTKLPSAKSRG
jgi:hypothetical protein